MSIGRRLVVLALSAVCGLAIAFHEQPRERAWAAAHTHALPLEASSARKS